jgi:putative sporulation protein YtaF
MLALSLFLASVISPVLPPLITKIFCFLILFILGVVKLFDSSIKSVIRKHKGVTKQLKFSMFNLNFILNIYADPEDADTDRSRDLSPYEAVSLAIALSLDGLAAGFGAGLVNFSLIGVFAFSIIFGILAILLGCHLGNKVAEKLSVNISWLSGALLAFLGVLKLIS